MTAPVAGSGASAPKKVNHEAHEDPEVGRGPGGGRASVLLERFVLSSIFVVFVSFVVPLVRGFR
jgi:hypothetical protein